MLLCLTDVTQPPELVAYWSWKKKKTHLI